jgi:hypothetical protein
MIAMALFVAQALHARGDRAAVFVDGTPLPVP